VVPLLRLKAERREFQRATIFCHRAHDVFWSPVLNRRFDFESTRASHRRARGAGQQAAELIESYPRLTAEMIQLAPVYAAAYPLRGRPRNQPLARSKADPPNAPRARHHHGVVRSLIDECPRVSTWSPSPGNPAMKPVMSSMSAARDGKTGTRSAIPAMVISSSSPTTRATSGSSTRRKPLHAGLVILIPAVNRVIQQRLFKAALDELAAIGEPVNRVLDVDLDGEGVTLTLYDLPPAES
jgi:hypothetical protein